MMDRQRRTVLAGLAAVAASRHAFAAMPRIRVGVVGAGILGASIAARLAEAGAEVLVFERKAPASGATRASVAWINPVVNDATYMKLRLASMEAWREDDRRYGMQAIWGGSISWAYPDRRADLQKKADVLLHTDDPPRYLTAAQLTDRAPGVEPGDVALAFETVRDGHVEPVYATGRYLVAAEANGARVIYPCAVENVVVENGHITGVRTSKGAFALDALVSATGTDTPRLMQMVGRSFALGHRPGLVIHTDRQPVVTPMVFEASSIIEFKQYADGRFLTSFTAGPPELPQHENILKERIDYPDPALQQWHGDMLVERTSKYLPAIARAKATEVLLGFRPYPLDNRPVVGPVPGVGGMYVAVTHSGITLAPIIGRYAAHEVLTAERIPMLQPYRPDRYIKV